MEKFNTHGGYFAPAGYLKVNEGGSHDENPNGGVQIGVDPEGVPNMLEEGEPVYNDFVYSDNISADEAILKEHNIPSKYAGKLYSSIADSFVDEAEERPLDPISNNGLNAMLVRLADAQEAQKQKEQEAELEEELSKLSPEELAQLEEMLAAEEQPEQMPVMEGGEGVEQMPVMGEPEGAEPVAMPMVDGGFAKGGPMNQFWGGGEEDEIDWNSLTPEEYERITGKKLIVGASNSMSPEEYERITGEKVIRSDWRKALDVKVPEVKLKDPEYNTIGYLKDVGILDNDGVQPIKAKVLPVPGNKTTNERFDETKELSERLMTGWHNAKLYNEQLNGRQNLPTWQRYVGTLGNALLGLYNLAQPADKLNVPVVNSYEPAYSPIHYQPLVYNPVDYNMISNNLLAQSAGTARGLRNSGLGPSAGANLIALDNNIGQNLGTGFIQAWDANNQQRNNVIQSNNATQMQIAQILDARAKERAAARERANRLNTQLSLTKQQYDNEAESQKYAAISQQLSNALQGISDIGNENLAYNMANNNRALLYGARKNGEMPYKGMNGGMNGGFIRQYKK